MCASHQSPTHKKREGVSMTVLASETASATAGREGKATSPDGKINLNLSPPGSNGPGTNPEQLFGAGYSACFGGAILAAAGLAKIPLKSKDVKVTATVNLNKDDSGGGYFIDVTLNAELTGIDQAQAEALVAKAHTLCPYSKATRGNIEVKLQANGKAVRQAA
jgi:lipoyl-dependent peroxiredoxin